MVDEVIVGVFTLVGVVLGAFLGFGLNLLREYLRERKQRTKYLMDLLSDFEYNKKLAEENKKWGYHTLGYIDAKGAKYTFELPKKLRMQIYDVQSMISAIFEKGETSRIKEIEKLLDNIIPEFKEYLKGQSIELKKSSSYYDEIKHGPDKEKRLDKFDNLLLFVSSLMGYLFVIIQFIFGKTAIVLLFAPLLIFGLIFPVYTGYIKGALDELTVYRVRGWIYFFFGLGIYLWFTFSFGILILLSTLNTVGNTFLICGILAAILAVCNHFSNFVSKKYDYQINKEDVKNLVFFIIVAAAYLAATIVSYFGYLDYQLYRINPLKLGYLLPYAIFLSLIGVLGCVIIFLTLFRQK